MSPAQLDLLIQGFFIYERADGTRYLSADYKLKDLGVLCLGRSGGLTQEDLQGTVAEAIERHTQRYFEAAANG